MGYITLHIRAGRMDEKPEETLRMAALMKQVTVMVEGGMGLKLDPDSFVFELFMTHLRYLIARIHNR